MAENFDIEAIIKPFVADVNDALKGFEGKAASLEAVIGELRAEQADIRRRAALGEPVNGERKSGWPEADRAALRDYITKGVAQLTGTSDAAGGFGVPLAIAEDIERLVKRQSPVRAVADVRSVDTPKTRLLIGRNDATSGWVGETATRTATEASGLAAIEPPVGTLYASAPVTEELLEDFAADIDAFMTETVVDEFASQESQAFINGNGTNRPKGFLDETIVASGDATRTFGELQYIATGNASTLGSDLPGKLLAMIFATKGGYRQAEGCAFMASTAVVQALSDLKDTQGRPLYLPSLREGTPGQLLGFTMVEAEHMPAVASNSFPIAFGNWRRGYSIVDRTATTILRDPYSVKGSVIFYVRKRVGGKVRNSEAIKVLKVAAS